MPLTEFQRRVLGVVAPARTPDSYLAGGTALHFSPSSTRFSHDLDLFHDAIERVAEAFEQDSALLQAEGYELEVVLSQPGFIRAVVRRGERATQIDWARDSAWRFMPVVKDELGGYLLHPVDLATNKVLVLAGRDEPRDFVDVLYVMDHILPLGAVVWAAVAKDPGFNPLSLLEHLRRRGRYRPEDVARLDTVEPFDLPSAKERWLGALDRAETFVRSRPSDEVGCLYYSLERGRFEAPSPHRPLDQQGLVPHYGRLGGVLPRPADQELERDGPAPAPPYGSTDVE
ncbi:MAG: nucleotidyl transferase AbiEii/AbiGii toxin family protein [Gemmatimonadota bacterium]